MEETIVGQSLVRNEYSSADELYRGVVQEVLESGTWVSPVTDPSSVGSRFGLTQRSFLEVSPVVIELEDPKARWTWNPVRQMSLVNAVGLWMWFLSHTEAVEDIGFYNERAAYFSDDGTTLHGALGRRFDRTHLESIERRLAGDPSTRRAVLPCFNATDVLASSRDIPCLLSVQFLLRADRLDLIASMRSTNAVGVFLYDVFVLTLLQELMARILRVDLGRYIQISNSMHIYEDELGWSREVLGTDALPRETHSMPSMPPTDWRMLETIVDLESLIRRDRLSPSMTELNDVPRYWMNFLCVGLIRRAVLNEDYILAGDLVRTLDEPFRSMIKSDPRFPHTEVSSRRTEAGLAS